MASNYLDPINILDSSNATGVGSGGSLNVSGGISVSKDTYIGGNLSISGTTTSFADNMITLNTQPSGSYDTGILLQRHSGDVSNNNNYSAIIYKELEDEFGFGYVTGDTRGNVNINTYTRIRTGGVSITGGSLVAPFNSNTVGSIITTGGNVGIGTNSPIFTLDVSGTARFTTGITTGALVSDSVAFNTVTGGSMSLSGNILAKELVLNDSYKSFTGVFNGSSNVVQFTNVTGLDLGDRYNSIFEVRIAVTVGSVEERFDLKGLKKSSGWTMFVDSYGELCGVTFDVMSNGQVQYVNSSNNTASITYYVTGI